MTRLDYGQFLLSSQVNYTLTYFADHSEKYTHDSNNNSKIPNSLSLLRKSYLLFHREKPALTPTPTIIFTCT